MNTHVGRSNIDSNPNSEGAARDAEGLNLVGMSGGSSMCCPPGGVTYKQYKYKSSGELARVRCSA